MTQERKEYPNLLLGGKELQKMVFVILCKLRTFTDFYKFMRLGNGLV